MSWTTNLTMGLAMERYLAVCRWQIKMMENIAKMKSPNCIFCLLDINVLFSRPLYYRSLELTYTRKVHYMIQARNILKLYQNYVIYCSFIIFSFRQSHLKEVAFMMATSKSLGRLAIDWQISQEISKMLKKKHTRKQIYDIFKTFFQARVLSYLVPAMLASVILNIPKFLEARLEEVSLSLSFSLSGCNTW